MKPKRNEVILGGHRLKNTQRGGSNWVLIVGGALLGAVSVRLWCKLKDFFDGRQSDVAHNGFRVNMKPAPAMQRSTVCSLDIDSYCGVQKGDSCCHCLGGSAESKQVPCSPISKDSDLSLQLITIPLAESNKDNAAIMWISSPEHSKPLHPSASSGSPSASESGSDIFIKRDVIQKLRQQLKRRDEMIMDMQAQISGIQNSMNSQMAHSSHLQSQLDAVNSLLFDSELEIQQLRKTIADYCLAGAGFPEKPANWQSELNGHANGYRDVTTDTELHCVGLEKSSNNERVVMLKREVGDLKEVIEGKEFLIQSYKEQKTELCSKINELQWRLSSQTLTML